MLLFLDFKDEMKGEIEKVGVENIIKHTKELCERNKDSIQLSQFIELIRI